MRDHHARKADGQLVEMVRGLISRVRPRTLDSAISKDAEKEQVTPGGQSLDPIHAEPSP